MVFSGAGSAAISITKLLLQAGFRDITLCDKFGALYEGNPNMNWAQQEIAKRTNLEKKQGTLADLLVGADVFIGVSAPGAVTKEMVQTMNAGAVIFACANPTPEIFPDDAKAGGAAVVATGRSDYPNQINNVLAFPGIFRGALDARASDINDAMKIAAAHALAELVGDDLSAELYHPRRLRSTGAGRGGLRCGAGRPRLRRGQSLSPPLLFTYAEGPGCPFGQPGPFSSGSNVHAGDRFHLSVVGALPEPADDLIQRLLPDKVAAVLKDLRHPALLVRGGLSPGLHLTDNGAGHGLHHHAIEKPSFSGA